MKTTNYRFTRFTKERYLAAFLLGFAVFIVTAIPVMLCEKGYFIYYGDYNAQQIPFYALANDAVRNGQLGWNWYTDLGSDLLTSYSFYLIGSPFFWLTVLLPRWLVTYSMPVLLALKHGFASLTAYIYIRKFVRSKNAALTGGLLYAFSGFQVFNLFFNHFHDVTAFFPLMLIAMENMINQNKKGWFAVTVALMACINYYFFTGQAVFLVIYYLVRMKAPDFNTSWKKFFLLAFEAIIGTAAAAFILLPSALLIIGNDRVNNPLFGLNAVIYPDKTLIPRIIQTFFMPCDIPANPNLFTSEYEKWASIGGYLPVFSMIGVITFMRTRKKHWASKFTAIIAVFAAIPILNSLFQAANGYYYARWFYMPILILSMMTAQVIDDEEADERPAVKINIAVLIAFGLIALIPTKNDKGQIKWFSLPDSILYFAVQLAVAAAGLTAAVILFRLKRKGREFQTAAVWVTAFASVICIFTASLYGAVTPSDAKEYAAAAINGRENLYEQTSEDNFFRIDISEDCDNYSMLWQVPNIRAFQSVVEPSIMRFYQTVGVGRDVASRADLTHYTLRGLLSVKYYYDEKNKDNENDKDAADIEDELPGFELVSENDHFRIYENKLYIPMGFGYDKCISAETASSKETALKEKLLIQALVLSDEQIERYSDIITVLPDNKTNISTKNTYETACREKQQNCASSFTFDSKGFEAQIELEKPELVFFSVPYSKGWSAQVNGEDVQVEEVSFGMMAVRAEKGNNSIVFTYRTPGLALGLLISGVSVLIFFIYIIISLKTRRKNELTISGTYNYASCTKVTASEAYCSHLFNK